MESTVHKIGWIIYVIALSLVWPAAGNAQPRCVMKELDFKTYISICSLVVVGDGMSEFKANSLEPGLQLAWQKPFVKEGNAKTHNCLASDDNLSFSCDIEIPSLSTMSVIDYPLKISKENKSKTTSDSLTLPYSVRVIAGKIPSVAEAYTLPEESASTYQEGLNLRRNMVRSNVRVFFLVLFETS